MFRLLVLAVLVNRSLCGGLYTASAPLATRTTEAHGPLARQALSAASFAGTTVEVDHQGADPRSVSDVLTAFGLVASRAGPVQHAGVTFLDSSPHVFHSEVAPIVRLLPSQVGPSPLQSARQLRVLSDDGFTQKVVNPKVTIAKLQVRRPAVKNNFYDIEERTLIRPVGSAIIEHQEPSAKYASPFVAPQYTFQYSPQYPSRLVYPVSSYPFFSYRPLQVPVQSYPQLIQPQIPQIPQIPQQPVVIPQPQPPQLPAYPQQPVVIPQPQPPQLPAYPQQPPSPPAQQPSQEFPSFPRPTEPQDSVEFDPSDTVVVENPDLSRSSDQERTDTSRDDNMNQEKDGGNRKSEDEEQKNKNILEEFQTRQALRISNPTNPVETAQQGLQKQQPQVLLRTQESSSEKESRTSEDITTQKEVESITPYSSQEVARVSNLTPEREEENLQKLLDFLTGRGEVAELGLTRSIPRVQHLPSGETGLRSRVVSVTPAPSTAPRAERVSTRRVVVSRPVDTVQEVEVQHVPLAPTADSLTVAVVSPSPVPSHVLYK